MTKSIWIGLDVHAESITAAILDGDSQEPEIVTLPGDLMKVRRLFRRLAKRGTPRACYEACGAGDRCRLVEGREGHRFYADDAWPVLLKEITRD
mgnify:CR=1 FL=1